MIRAIYSQKMWREYHEATKHTPEKLRSSTHYLDWANRPDPFRHYEGAPLLDLPADPPSPQSPTLELLNDHHGSTRASKGADFLSQLLFYSAAISASKRVPSTGEKYALRVNPSSGNLHPTEFHFVTQTLKNWPDGLYHYRPSSHMAERRAIVASFQPAPITFVLTTIAWREAWKYQDRAYRYCLLDMGHACEALILSARAIGCDAIVQEDFDEDNIAHTYNLAPDEWPLLMIQLSGPRIPIGTTPDRGTVWHGGKANALSNQTVPYPLIDRIHAATKLRDPAPWTPAAEPPSQGPAIPSRPFGEVARARRSALDFRGGSLTMSLPQLSTILACAMRSTHYIEIYAYVHRVEGLNPGVYRYRAASRVLELMQPGDQRIVAAALSLRQDLAGNACVAFSMIADLDRATRIHGDRGYRYAHFEAGAIGQRIYVAAEALGLQATGMGAFFDDRVHEYLHIERDHGQVVYHFAIGYAVPDPRLRA